MVRNFILLLSFITFSVFTQSFSNLSHIGSKSMGMAGAVVSDVNDLETVFYNPAGLVNVKPYSFVAGTTDLYGLKFLNHQFLSLSLPYKSAVSIQQLGTNSSGLMDKNLSSEKSISFSKAFYLLNDANSTLSIGYNINGLIFYQSASAGVNGDGTGGLSSGETTTVGLDIGVHASLRNKISFGAFIKNINNPSIDKGSSSSQLPRRMDVGFTYNPFDGLYTTFAIEKILGQDQSSFRFGIQYDIIETLSFRTGIQMNPNRFGFGLSYKFNKLEMSYSLLTHHLLSPSNLLSIKVNLGR
jgi:hypothetical protein